MSGLATRIARLSPTNRRLAAESVMTLGLAALVVAFLPFRWISALVRFPECAIDDVGEQQRAIAAVRWAVRVSSRRVPWRAKCLEQALAVHWMLRRRSVTTVIHYGIAKRIDGLGAHAWVSAGSIQVIGFESADEFGEVVQFPSQNRTDSSARANVRFALLRRPRL